jgi:hypothetical protein
MFFEWDNTKARSNERKHNVSFEEAKTVFDDPFYIDFFDPDHSFDENRFIILGQSLRGRLLFVAYTERTSSIRIISAREATKTEHLFYEKS